MKKINNLFTKIYSEYYNDVFRIAYNYTLNRYDSEDIVQQAFTKLYKNISKFHLSDDEIKKWLFRVAINDSKNYLLSAWKQKTNLKDDLEMFGVKNDESSLFYELTRINRKYRITLYLFYFDGYSIKEIAEILKITESNVKQRLKRGKEKLKREMEGKCEVC